MYQSILHHVICQPPHIALGAIFMAGVCFGALLVDGWHRRIGNNPKCSSERHTGGER